MSAPVPQGRTSCAAQQVASSVAAPQTISQSGNSHALPSTSGLDTADPAPRAGDAPSRRRGRTRPENQAALRDLTRPAADRIDEFDGHMTLCPLRGPVTTAERRA
jgi:hypothetical protein